MGRVYRSLFLPPTNYDPIFSPGDASYLSYTGHTPAGAEPSLITTASTYPFNSPVQGLFIIPQEFSSKKFEMFKKCGGRSP